MNKTCKFCGKWCCYDYKNPHQIEWVIPHGRREKEYFHVDCFYKSLKGEDFYNWFKKEDVKDEDSD